MPDLFDTVLQNFQESKKKVHRYLGVGAVFFLISFFYIVEPYFQYNQYLHTAKQDSVTVSQELDRLNNQIDEISSVHSDAGQSLSSILSRIDNLPEHLHNIALPEIQRAIRQRESPAQNQAVQQIQQPPQDQPQFSITDRPLPDDITDFESAVHWYIQEIWFRKLVGDLNEEVIGPATEIGGMEIKGARQKIDTLTDNAITEVNQHLGTIDPDFWRSYQGGKVPTSEALQEVVGESFKPILSEIETLKSQTEQRLATRKDSLEVLKSILKNTKSNIQNLDNRISSLESQFGPIPLSITELIVLFPILLVGFMVLTSTALSKSSRLYSELRRHVQSNHKNTHSNQLSVYADCWYLPPYSYYFKPVLLGLFAIILLGIYIYASILIYSDPSLFVLPNGEINSLRYIFFTGAYLLGIPIFATSLWVSINRIMQSIPKPSGME